MLHLVGCTLEILLYTLPSEFVLLMIGGKTA
jgi:hypothetical protein